jgi:UDP-N-acetylglucosamine 2-epimerase (non-hydrolysing)
LRTGDKYAPYPEEVYRRLVADLADLHFAPTHNARAHLLHEGIESERIYVTGNTAVDALRLVLARDPRETSLAGNAPLLAMLTRRFVLITCHRRESFGADMAAIMTAIGALARRHPQIDFLFPVHLNPNVGGTVHRLLDGYANVRLTAPLDYAAFAHLLEACYLVMTDSGGIQEEAAELGKPVLVLRRTTERAEGVTAGTAILVGVEAAIIEQTAHELLEDEATYRRYAIATHVYGDGRAAEAIVRILDSTLNPGPA